MTDCAAKGRCACGSVEFTLADAPFAVHACHCSYCQRETGGAFAVNALTESDAVVVEQGTTEIIDTPSASGNGQKIIRCADCHSPLWSHYFPFGEGTRFVRVGALEEPDQFPPDAHIYCSAKPKWLTLPKAEKAFPTLYPLDDVSGIFGAARAARWWKAVRS